VQPELQLEMLEGLELLLVRLPLDVRDGTSLEMSLSSSLDESSSDSVIVARAMRYCRSSS
jgi:hypothetical protein